MVQAGADVAAKNRHTLMTPFLYAVKSGTHNLPTHLLTTRIHMFLLAYDMCIPTFAYFSTHSN